MSSMSISQGTGRSGRVYSSIDILKTTKAAIKQEFPTIFENGDVTKEKALEELGMLDKVELVCDDGQKRLLTVAQLWPRKAAELATLYRNTYRQDVPANVNKTQILHEMINEATRRGVNGVNDDADVADGDEEVYQPLPLHQPPPLAVQQQQPVQQQPVQQQPVAGNRATIEQLKKLSKAQLIAMCRDANRDVPRSGLGSLNKTMLSHALAHCNTPPTVEEVAIKLMS